MSYVLSITFGEGVNEGLILDRLRVRGLSGTIYPEVIGYTPEWGVEHSITVVTTVGTKEERDTVEDFVASILSVGNEQAAFVTTNGGLPQLWKASDSAKLVIQGI